MVFALLGLIHIIGTSATQIIAHGGLSWGIAKGFTVCATQWFIAHPGTVAAGAAVGYGIKKATPSNDDKNE